MGEFGDKVAVITGGAAGIGKAAARAFADHGARVVIADINGAEAEAVARELGDCAIGIEVDVARDADCRALIEKAVSSFGRVDVLFNNAAIAGVRAKLADQTTEDWLRVMDVNLNGVFYCSRAAIPFLERAGGGVIINHASVDGLVGMATIPHYTASKHAVIGLSKAIALEYGSSNIRCVAICSGFIDTAMTQAAFSKAEADAITGSLPIKRSAKPEEVAGLVLWLASAKAGYVTGCAYQIDGGILAGFGAG